MSEGFRKDQLRKLAAPLDLARVQWREQSGKSLAYLEGWFVIQEANRIFGYDGWDRQMVAFERLFASKEGGSTTCGYMARVKLSVRLQEGPSILREGSGFGQASSASQGDAHERALKAAETDATKRALATFGARFGLLLHDRDNPVFKLQHRGRFASEAVSNEEKKVHRATPAPEAQNDEIASAWDICYGDTCFRTASAESFCSALRQFVRAAETPQELLRLRNDNKKSFEQLRALPQLKSARGTHYADILENLIAKRIKAVEELTPKPGTQNQAQSPAESIARNAKQESQNYVPVPPYPMARLIERFAPQVPISTSEQLPKLALASDPSNAASDTNASSALNASNDAEIRPVPAAAQSAASPEHFAFQGSVASAAPKTPTRRSQIARGHAVDKSILAIPSERRLRSKAHLARVAARPCLVCEALPCHAHHITFAQPRGLSQKVSDEFTVPLCALHHNALHQSGSERSWWRAQAIEPLAIARKLWEETSADLT